MTHGENADLSETTLGLTKMKSSAAAQILRRIKINFNILEVLVL